MRRRDFTAAAQRLRAVPDRGYGNRAVEAVGAPDVRYFHILSGVVDDVQMLEDQSVVAVLTLVWRPERHGWLVHALGGYLAAEDVPRGRPRGVMV